MPLCTRCSSVVLRCVCPFFDTSFHAHVRVMMVIRWLFEAHFVDVAGPWISQSHGLNTANVVSSCDISLCCTMEKRVGQWVARHPLCTQTVLVIMLVFKMFGCTT